MRLIKQIMMLIVRCAVVLYNHFQYLK